MTILRNLVQIGRSTTTMIEILLDLEVVGDNIRFHVMILCNSTVQRYSAIDGRPIIEQQ